MPPSGPLINQRGQLRDVSVGEIEFARNWEWDDEKHGDIRYSVSTETEVLLSKDREFGFVDYDASVHWLTAEGEEDDVVAPFNLAVKLHAVFDLENVDADAEDTKAWLSFNADTLLWPYLRTYVQVITGWSDIPELVLYTVSVPRLRVRSDEAVDEAADRTFG